MAMVCSSSIKRLPPRPSRRGSRIGDVKVRVPVRQRIAVDLPDVRRGRTFNRNPARLHGLRDFADQFDLQQAVVKGRALNLDVVRQTELPLERPDEMPWYRNSCWCFSACRPSTVTTLCSAVIAIWSGEKPATASEIW